eukprot:351227-Chlamydomonas_euryale.AAC.4
MVLCRAGHEGAHRTTLQEPLSHLKAIPTVCVTHIAYALPPLAGSLAFWRPSTGGHAHAAPWPPSRTRLIATLRLPRPLRQRQARTGHAQKQRPHPRGSTTSAIPATPLLPPSHHPHQLVLAMREVTAAAANAAVLLPVRANHTLVARVVAVARHGRTLPRPRAAARRVARVRRAGCTDSSKQEEAARSGRRAREVRETRRSCGVKDGKSRV